MIVTEKTTNLIDSYHIRTNGSLSQPTFTPSTGNEPFGFAFNPVQSSHFIVSDAFGGAPNAGAVTSYELQNGKVNLDDGPVADHQTAPCWVAITGNGLISNGTEPTETKPLNTNEEQASSCPCRVLRILSYTGKRPLEWKPL